MSFQTTRLDYRSMLDAFGDPVVAASSNTIVYINRAAERLLGWPAHELIGQCLTVIQPPHLRAAHLAGVRRYLETGVSHIIGHPIRVPALRRDGSQIEIELVIGALPLDGGQLFVASLRDLGERIELERQLAVTKYLRASTAAAAKLTSLLDLDAVLGAVVETLVNDFQAVLARIWLAEPESGALSLRAQADPADPPSVTQELHYTALPVWIDQVIRARSAFVQNNLTDDPRFDQEWISREGITAVSAFPLLIGHNVRGVMVLFSRRPFSDELFAVLTSFAAIVTASINDVELFVREQEARSNAEASQARSDFLADASRILAGSLDYETTLRNLARLIVPHIADWCIVDMLDAEGQLERLEVAHSDPARVKLVDEYRRHYAPEPNHSQSSVRVIRTGQPEIVREITDEMLVRGARSEDHLALLRGLGFTSYMCVPLTAHGRTRGAIGLVAAESNRRFGASDLAVAEDLARRAAIAVDNACLYQELQEAVRIRDEFLDSVSHDLKNPISAIKGRVQMLQRRTAHLPGDESERYERGLESIDTAATRMIRLISDLVDVTRSRIGQPLELDTAPIDLIELVRQASLEQQHGLEGQPIQVFSELEGLVGEWDAMRLERVMANILSNAVKYSPVGGEIAVDIRREQRDLDPVAVITVRDTGVGIPAQDLPHIFERFYRGTNVVGKIEGTGIGLAGAKQIVEQHNGTISVESREDEGTTFTVVLPLVTTARTERGG